jgi:hypothetical protein
MIRGVYAAEQGLWYQRKLAGSSIWNMVTVTSAVDPSGPAIAFDGAGVMHGAYHFDGSVPSTAYVRYDGASTVIETIAAEASQYRTAIAVDSADGVHVAYYDFAQGLRYAYRDPMGIWHVETLAPTGASRHRDMVIDAMGGVHMVYDNGTNMIHAYREPC